MSPTTQEALLVTEIGKPLTLKTDQPVSEPGPEQVLVRVKVAGPNPHDQKARDTGLFIAEHLPAVLGNDVVGEAVTLGTNVTKYAVGDLIVGQASFQYKTSQNAFQEYAVLDVDFSAKLPRRFTADDGATLPTNVIASLVALFDASALAIPAPWTTEAATFDYKGTTLLVMGGGSNCGRFGVQLAALAGIGRIIVVGGDEAELKSYGATSIRDIVGDDLLYAYDTVNPAATQTIAVNALSTTKKGKLARLIPRGTPDESQILFKKDGYHLLNVFGSSHVRPMVSKPFWDRLPQYLEEGKLKPTGYEVVDLKGWEAEKMNDLLDRLRDGKKVIKTHFHLTE